jgi:hypothetical protein
LRGDEKGDLDEEASLHAAASSFAVQSHEVLEEKKELCVF